MILATREEAPAEAAGVARRWRFGLATVVLAVVMGILVGYAVGVVTLRPDPTPGDTSPEAGFARDMTAHHAQAVDMGVTALARATTPELRNLGMDIALTQQLEIGMMQQWLRDWGLLPSGTQPPMAWMPGGEELVVEGLMPGMATQEQMSQLRELEGTDVDRLFLELMIEHHLGGGHMIDAVLELSDDPEVTWLASTMKRAQAAEVQVMQGYLERIPEPG